VSFTVAAELVAEAIELERVITATSGPAPGSSASGG